MDWISLALKCCNRTGRWLHEKPANNALKKQQSLNYLLRVSVKDLLTLPLAIMFRCSFFTCFRLREALTNIIRPTWPDLFGMNMRSVYSDHTLNALLSSASTFCRGKFRGYLLILYVSFFTRHLEPVTFENGDGALKKCEKYLRRYLPLLSTPILSRFYSFAWFALLRMAFVIFIFFARPFFIFFLPPSCWIVEFYLNFFSEHTRDSWCHSIIRSFTKILVALQSTFM